MHQQNHLMQLNSQRHIDSWCLELSQSTHSTTSQTQRGACHADGQWARRPQSREAETYARLYGIALHCLPGKSAAVLHFVRALCGLKKGYIHVPGTETNPNISSFVTSHDSLWILASKPACNTVQACHFSLRRASKCSLESLKEYDVSSKHYAKKCVCAPCHQCRRLVGIASWYCINCIAYI